MSNAGDTHPWVRFWRAACLVGVCGLGLWGSYIWYLTWRIYQ